VVIGVGTIGCCRAKKKDIEKEECHAEMNIWSAKYNDGLKLMLQKLQDEFKDINYSHFDTFSIFSNLIQNPASYGTNLLLNFLLNISFDGKNIDSLLKSPITFLN
jgi:hypothetical protein